MSRYVIKNLLLEKFWNEVTETVTNNMDKATIYYGGIDAAPSSINGTYRHGANYVEPHGGEIVAVIIDLDNN